MLNRSVKTVFLGIILICCFGVTPVSYSADNYQQYYPAGYTINGNLWDSIQDRLALPDYSNVPAVQKQIVWFQKHQGYLNRVIVKSAPYMYYIFQLTSRRNLPAELALLPIIESGFNPFGYSNVGADGLWQMMPGTASGLGLKIDWWYDGRRDVVASTDAAFNYLAYLNDFFTSDWLLAIAAYDCGEGCVQKAVKYNKKHDQPTSFWYLHLPKETEVYVPKLLALSAIIRDPDRYGIHLMPINDAPYLTQVNVGSQIDLSQAAKLADVSVETIRKLNPGFRRWATDPDGPYTLLIPANKEKEFQQRLDAMPKSQRVTWREHVVKSGDNLGTLAHKYKTNIDIIKEVNHIKSNLIRPKQVLLIPVAYRGSIKSPILRQRTTITEEKIPGPQRVVHIVENGDTLYIIALKYGVTVRAIRFWNNLQPGDTLSPNQKLLIWAPRHSKLLRQHFFKYKVQKDDTVSVIAERFNTSSKVIARANRLKHNIIHPGQVLTIPVKTHAPNHRYRYKVKSGDNLGLIAKRFGTTSKDIMKGNNLKTILIRPGQMLSIPMPTHSSKKTIKKHHKATHHHKSKHNTYTVKSGDNLKSIAKKYHLATKALMHANNLKLDMIHSGQELVIPKK